MTTKRLISRLGQLGLIVMVRSIQIITIINLVAILVLVSLQVISRFTSGLIPSIPDEIVSLCLVWMIFLAAAVLCKDDEHLRVEWLEKKAKQWRIPYFLLRTSLELLFIGVFFYSALRLYRASSRAITHTLLLPMRWWYLSLPVSAGLMVLFVLLNVGKKITYKEGENVYRQELGRGRSGGS